MNTANRPSAKKSFSKRNRGAGGRQGRQSLGVHTLHAMRYSAQGLRVALSEQSFQLEIILTVIFVPLTFWLAQTWLERVVLIAPLFLALAAELFNTALEAVVDMVSPQWQPLAGRAKDTASAGVFVTLMLGLLVWSLFLYDRFL